MKRSLSGDRIPASRIDAEHFLLYALLVFVAKSINHILVSFVSPNPSKHGTEEVLETA